MIPSVTYEEIWICKMVPSVTYMRIYISKMIPSVTHEEFWFRKMIPSVAYVTGGRCEVSGDSSIAARRIACC